MSNSNQTSGIKIRVAKDKMIQLVDRETGQWIANVRWRPCGVVQLEVSELVSKDVVAENSSIVDRVSAANECHHS
jgi:hypothetical protein